MVNVEHDVAVRALRTNTNYFHIIVARDVRRNPASNPNLSSLSLSLPSTIKHDQSEPKKSDSLNLANYLNDPVYYGSNFPDKNTTVSFIIYIYIYYFFLFKVI